MLKKYKEYIITILITLLILGLIFILKDIYPFGNNTLIFGDMYDQITAYYYYLYDALRGNESLLINFASSNGINFFGIIFYYLASPLSLLILLVERSKIHLFISIIIALKILLCNITCLYMLKNLFKNNNSLLSVCLALLYGFSAYSLNFYQITSWIDAMYMLPLIIIGLKKLFEEDNPKLYLIALTLSLFFSFYISFMIIIFIFLLSGIFLYNYYNKKEIPKKILSLGISTVLSLGISLLIVIPTYKQISISSRMISTLDTLINSKLGPLTDKIALFISGPIIFIAILLLLKDYKKHKKFLKFYIPSMILLLIPVVIEPVNKVLHFMSYASFPYRFGFITTLFMIIGAGYFFNNYKTPKIEINNLKKIISILITIVTITITIFLTKFKYIEFQDAIDSLTLSRNKILIIILLGMFILTSISSFIIILLNKNLNKLSLILISLLTITHITCNSYLYLGIDFIQKDTKYVYETLNEIEKDNINTIFRLKDETSTIINNSSNVTKIPSMDHFSSLTDGQTQKTLKLLGYSSYWTHTHSKGGTLFTDILLGNKYLLNTEKETDNYTFIKEYNNLYLHELNHNISFGYLIDKDIDITKYHNTFEIQNAIYNSITNDKDLFEIIDNIKYKNIKIKDNNYTIIDKNKDNYVEFDIKIDKERTIYLELYKSTDNMLNNDIYKLFNIINFGTYKDEKLNIKIEFLENCYLESLNIGLLNNKKLNNFTSNYQNNHELKFNENKINIKINSDKKQTLFIPISNNDSYKAYNNERETKINNIYNTYIGIELEKGENNITIEFIPSYLKICSIISILFIITSLIILRKNIYNKIINIKFLQKLSKYIYLTIYIGAIIVVYLLPILGFFLSFITYIKL